MSIPPNAIPTIWNRDTATRPSGRCPTRGICFRAFARLAVVAVLIGLLAAVGCLPSPTPSEEQPAGEGSAAEPDATPSEAAPETVREPRRAETGVGRQGRGLDDETGVGRMIAQPAVSLFDVRERTVFEIQIPQAMQLFEATEGRKPNSHEEFMQRIIEANKIQLPELPAGSQYRYEPEKGELWVYPESELGS